MYYKHPIFGLTQEWFRELCFSRLECGVHGRLGAIQVLDNAIFLEIGPPHTPLLTLITLNITPS